MRSLAARYTQALGLTIVLMVKGEIEMTTDMQLRLTTCQTVESIVADQLEIRIGAAESALCAGDIQFALIDGTVARHR